MHTADARDDTLIVMRRDDNRGAQLPMRLLLLHFYEPGEAEERIAQHPRFKLFHYIHIIVYNARVLCLIRTKLSLLRGSDVNANYYFYRLNFSPWGKSCLTVARARYV